jgi:hypothetical protein
MGHTTRAGVDSIACRRVIKVEYASALSVAAFTSYIPTGPRGQVIKGWPVERKMQGG